MKNNSFISLVLLVAALSCSLGALAQSPDGTKVYLLDFGYLKEAFSHEVGGGLISHINRSDVLATTYEFSTTMAYPQPVYANTFSVFTLTYEPALRLIEIGSNHSFSLNVPMVGALSIVDVCVGDGEKFAPRPEGESLDNLGRMYNTRNSYLGAGHIEAGGLLVYNIGSGSTIENTRSFGMSLGAGYIHTYALFSINEEDRYVRSDFSEYLNWGHFVGQLGLRNNDVGLKWTFSLLPSQVSFQSRDEILGQTVTTGLYQRVTFTIDIPL